MILEIHIIRKNGMRQTFKTQTMEGKSFLESVAKLFEGDDKDIQSITVTILGD